MEIALTVLFCLTPIVLIVHLAIKKNESNTYKKKLGYIHAGLWAISFIGYGWLYIVGH